MTDPKLRRRVLVELGSLGVATVVFLLLFPDRPNTVNVALAVLAVIALAINRRFTSDRIWSGFPTGLDRATRIRKAWLSTAIVTGIGLAGFLVAAVLVGHGENGWRGVTQRVANPNLPLAILFYIPWALLQQTLFQFYLLGRLLVIQRSWVAILITGLAYSLVHLPHVGVTLATAGAGIIWTALYHRYRCLTPLAISHAVLGSAFYYWIYNRDLMAWWSKLNL